MKRWLPNALLLTYAVAVTAALLTLHRVGDGPSRPLMLPDTTVSPVPRTPVAHPSPLPASRSGYTIEESKRPDLRKDFTPATDSGLMAAGTVVFEPTMRRAAAEVSDSLRAEAVSIAAASLRRETERAELRHMPASELTHSDILLLADIVDHEANRRLRAVARRHDLDEQQQDHAFRIFAGASTAYNPVLGEQTDPASPEDEVLVVPPDDAADQQVVDELIHDLLDEEQQEDFEEEWVDRDQWWTEIVSQLSDDLDAELVAPPEENDDPQAGQETDPEDHLGGNLFDLLGQ